MGSTRILLCFIFCIVACIMFSGCSGGAGSTAQNDECAKNLLQIYFAIRSVDDSGTPGGIDDIRDKDGKPLLSWRVKLLAFLEEIQIYNQFKLDEPWDSAHNKTLLAKVPGVLLCDVKQENGKTRYYIATGPGAAIDGNGKLAPLEQTMPQRMPHIILAFESGAAVDWSKPGSPSLDEAAASLADGPHEGSWVVFADGAVRLIPRGTPVAILKELLTADVNGKAKADDFKENASAKDLKRRAEAIFGR